MVFWVFAFAITAIACAALYYAAAGRRVDAARPGPDGATLDHFRLQLDEIASDAGEGRLGETEAAAAKAELARELLRSKAEVRPLPGASLGRPLLLGAVAATAVLAFGVYGILGHPDVPAQPLLARADIPPADMTLDDAVKRIEARLKQAPDDIRGWTVVAPAYMQLGRFADAAAALRKAIAIGGPTADRETDLGEAIMMAAGGDPAGEPMQLFESAAARDPRHVRSRYYLASELTRTGDYAEAVPAWNALLALKQGGETWVANAEAGLAAAQAGLDGKAPVDTAMIGGMVDGLSARLKSKGGTIEEWTRLVRSRLVQGEVEKAQEAYDAARKAYPDPKVRTELDVLAADNGLVARQ